MAGLDHFAGKVFPFSFLRRGGKGFVLTLIIILLLLILTAVAGTPGNIEPRLFVLRLRLLERFPPKKLKRTLLERLCPPARSLAVSPPVLLFGF